MTLALDADTLDLAERVTTQLGISISTLASRTIRNEALRLGAPQYALDSDIDAIYDEAEWTIVAQQENGRQGNVA